MLTSASNSRPTIPMVWSRLASRWRISISSASGPRMRRLLAQVSGKCIHQARRSNSKLPNVGDWVAVKLVPNEEKAVVQAILPRRTQLSRKITGHGATEQILATNIDTAFLVTAADTKFSHA